MTVMAATSSAPSPKPHTIGLHKMLAQRMRTLAARALGNSLFVLLPVTLFGAPLYRGTAVLAATATAKTVTRTDPAVVPSASQFDIRSKIIHRTYRIYITHPSGAAPKEGWPVIYVLDGDITFATVASQNMLRTAFGDSGAIIVGIGYPDIASSLVLRNRDLTISAPNEVGRRIGLLGDAKAEDWGGAASFHRFISEELKPAVRSMYPVDEAAQTLMGYSYGGLFALNVLFTDPGAYQTYVIGSPSIWWNGDEILAKEAAFAARVRSGQIAPRILITSSGLEQDPGVAKLPPDPAQRALTIDAIRQEKMVDNARELAARLQALDGEAGYRVNYVVFAGETHMSGLPAAVSRGYRFSMEPR